MTISFEFLAVAIGLAITISTFMIMRIKDAENRGRLLERVDQLEKDIKVIHERAGIAESNIGNHNTDIVKITADIESLHDLMERMDKKLDRMLEREDARASQRKAPE